MSRRLAPVRRRIEQAYRAGPAHLRRRRERQVRPARRSYTRSVTVGRDAEATAPADTLAGPDLVVISGPARHRVAMESRAERRRTRAEV
jgi:hypothetical protein